MLGLVTLLALLAPRTLPAQSAAPTGVSAKYLGAPSCASSSCHGGGGEHQNQHLVWSLKDYHSQRPVATLATARSRQIADALHLSDPTSDARCTTCHAPLQAVPAGLRGPGFNAAEGVTCESCHGPAENWLRAHTRHDWSHADRVFAGLRDLSNLYVRANTCVACHQTVELPLLSAGHPELTFELDGQSAAEPRHWQEATNWNRAQTWYVGQAVALRELSWQLGREPQSDPHLIARWQALAWLLQKLNGLDPALPGVGTLASAATPDNFRTAQRAADTAALTAATLNWPATLAPAMLARLAGTTADFATPVTGELPARQAERLVLALDRLLLAQSPPAPPSASDKLNELFKAAQSIPDFEPAGFGVTLGQFAGILQP